MKRISIDLLSLFALFAFALAQPLLDLLGRYGEFFVAHEATLVDVVILALVPSVLLPAAVAALEWLLERWAPEIRIGFHLAIVGVLTGVLVLAPLDRIQALSGLPAFGLTALAIPLSAWAYARIEAVRSFVALLSASSLIFPLLFVSNSNVRRAVARAPSITTSAVEVEARNPVVVVIFDELPLSSLIDRELEIDAGSFPNFASLSKRSHWFRGAMTVSPATTVSVPAILDGRLPQPGLLATQADHPETLFSILSGSHRIRAFETVTQLWPYEQTDHIARDLGFRTLAIDSAVAGLHTWTPANLRKWLPPVNLNWGGFVNVPRKSDRTAETARDRGALMRDFIAGIRKERPPTFHFIHILLPHFPWEFLPSGRRYGSVSPFSVMGTGIAGVCSDSDKWCASQDVVDQNYERHMLQVRFVDRLLGELVDQLESEGIFEETLLVVTSDHGVSFRTQNMRRAADQATISDILPIPLFIKAPNQKEGSTNDRIVETIDILPTICDLLGIELPWSLDGRSVLDMESPGREDKRYYPSPSRADVVYLEKSAASVSEAVRRKYETFPSGSPYQLGLGETSWLGKTVEEVGVVGASGLRVEIENGSYFENVDPGASFVPAFVSGKIIGGVENDSPAASLAIAVSGVLCARATPYEENSGGLAFFGVLPESCFRAGSNEIAIYAIAGEGAQSELLLVETSSGTYRLVETAQGGTLISPAGETLPVISGQIEGHLDSSDAIGDKVEFSGWAADIIGHELVERVVVLVNGEGVFSGATYIKRPGVAKYAGGDEVLESGFLFSFPKSRLASSDVRVFAVSQDGRAEEFDYHKGYRWRRSSSPISPHPSRE